MDAQAPSGSYMGSGLTMQILSGIAIVIVLYLSLAVAEYIYRTFTTMFNNRVELFPNTYVSNGKLYTAVQDPSSANPLTIPMSSNQTSGIEFSYSMFINISSATFSSGDQKLYHILHKGYNQVYPLLGPGIFCWGNTNTLRVYMNCYNTWANYTEIPNIPVDKWFHITVSCKGNTLYVYINGSLKNKQNLSGSTPPYQNYGNVYLFNPRKLTISCTKTQSIANTPDCPSNLTFNGAAQGMVSRVFYYGYALTYTEIQSLMNMGPSPNMNGPDMSISPYMADTWWTDSQTP